MSRLAVTLINVGWGDSVFIESESASGELCYALVDSNDKGNVRSSLAFLRRHFQLAGIDIDSAKPLFDFVMLTHAHSDHGQGLKSLIMEFETLELWYPKSLPESSTTLAQLESFARRSRKVGWHEALDTSKPLPKLGDVNLSVLWPQPETISENENDNSIVLHLKLGQVSFVLTGDAEAETWRQIASSIPTDTRFFKVPHHGSVNGTFDGDTPVWLGDCPQRALLGVSGHVVPHGHPHQRVINLFEQSGRDYFRTDEQYHLTFETDGHVVKAKYSQLTDFG